MSVCAPAQRLCRICWYGPECGPFYGIERTSIDTEHPCPCECHRPHECGPLCPEHGDPRDTSIAPSIPFVLEAPAVPHWHATVYALSGSDRVEVAQRVGMALDAAGIAYMTIQVDRAEVSQR